MTVELRVYDPTNSTLLGTLSEAYNIRMLDELRLPGTLTFGLDLASTSDVDLLLPASGQRRRTRVRIDGQDVWTGIVQDRPATLAADEGPSVSVQCLHLLAGLGWGSVGGGRLEPYGGTSGQQRDPRMFGPMAVDFVERDGEWTSPSYGGLVVRAGFADRRAERFVFSSRAIYRRTVEGVSGRDGPSIMEVTAAAWTEATVYLDGDELMRKPSGQTSVVSVRLPYDGEDHLVVLDCVNDAGSPGGAVVWSWATLEDPDDDDRRNALFRTFDPANLAPGSGAGSPGPWRAAEDFSTYPGVTVGRVLDTALSEAQGRGAVPWVGWDFDPLEDSGGTPWVRRFARGFRVQKLGQLVDELSGLEGEVEMTPSGLLRMWRRRGVDRTASVTVTAPFGLTSSGRGPVATDLLYETDGGFGRAISAAAETSLGEKLEEVGQFGSDLTPDQLVGALADQLARDGRVWSEVEVDLPDDVVPYQDVQLGDTVLCRTGLGDTVSPVRLSSFMLQVEDTNGAAVWSATGEPVL